MAGRRWSRKKVIEAIRERHRQGLPIKNMTSHDSGLCVAAGRYCGSWTQALIDAGLLEYACPIKRLSKEGVVFEIQQRKKQGLPMKCVAKDNRPLANAARVWFGSWSNALAAAGIKPQPRIKWNAEKVVEVIQEYYEKGFPLYKIWIQDKSLYWAAKEYFGGWKKALCAAGVPKTYRNPSQWNPERVIEEIQQVQREGKPLTKLHHTNKPLTEAARRIFGSWHNALKAVGLKPIVRQSWSREKIVAEIQYRHSQGLPLRNISKERPQLCAAAYGYFGGWDNALQAAGFKPKEPVWSRRRVTDEIKAWHDRGLPFSRIWKEYPCLAYAISKYFNNTKEAMNAAGFEWRLSKKWSAEVVIAEIQAWYKTGLPKSELKVVFPGLEGAAMRYFSSWSTALEMAGLQPRETKKWSREKIIHEIQRLHVHGQPLKTTNKKNRPLMSAATRYFGSWPKALKAAGVVAPVRKYKKPQKWSKESILEAIHARHEQGLLTVNVRQDDIALSNAAVRFFGGWQAAVEAAGLARPKMIWSKALVIAEIQSYARQGVSVDHLRKNDWNLCRIAKEHFGTWHQAVVAAEVDTSKTRTRTRWSRQRVLDEIRQRHSEGLPLTSSWPANSRLVTAAQRYCGRWTEALQMAGVDSDTVGH